jgi:hypothetical protein
MTYDDTLTDAEWNPVTEHVAIGDADEGILQLGTAYIGQANDTIGGTVLDDIFIIRNTADQIEDIGMMFVSASDIPRFVIAEEGSDLATYNPRSMVIGPAATMANMDENILCSTNFSNIDCDTGATGADLGVMDDIEFGGDIYGSGAALTTNLEAADNNTTQLASTSFVQQEINGAGGTDLSCSSGQCNVDAAVARLDDPDFTSTPTAPTAAGDTNTTQLATTAFVQQEINDAGGTDLTCATGSCDVDAAVARLAGPVFTGDAQAVTAAADDDDTSVATTEYVQAEISEFHGVDVTGFQIIIPNPDLAYEYVIMLPPFTGTMTRVDCESFGGTSVTINICDGEDLGDDTCTTSILDATASTTLECTTSPTADTSLNATGFVARDKVSLILTADSGTVDQLTVMLTVTVD